MTNFRRAELSSGLKSSSFSGGTCPAATGLRAGRAVQLVAAADDDDEDEEGIRQERAETRGRKRVGDGLKGEYLPLPAAP